MAENIKKSSAVMILFAWLIVGIPLGVGRVQYASEFHETISGAARAGKHHRA